MTSTTIVNRHLAGLTLKVDEDVYHLQGHESGHNLTKVAIPINDIHKAAHRARREEDAEREGEGREERISIVI